MKTFYKLVLRTDGPHRQVEFARMCFEVAITSEYFYLYGGIGACTHTHTYTYTQTFIYIAGIVHALNNMLLRYTNTVALNI